MKGAHRTGRFLLTVGALSAIFLATGCTRPDPNQVQGYVEGEFVYVASPLAGALQSLPVQRGTRSRRAILCSSWTVRRSRPPVTKRNDGWRRLAPHWEDVKKGKRPSEIDALEAQLKQARRRARPGRKRICAARGTDAYPRRDGRTGISTGRGPSRDQARQRVAQLEADSQRRS